MRKYEKIFGGVHKLLPNRQILNCAKWLKYWGSEGLKTVVESEVIFSVNKS